MSRLPRTVACAFVLSIAIAAQSQTCGEWVIVDKPMFEGARVYPLLIAPLSPESAVAVRAVNIPGGQAILRMQWDGASWTSVGADLLGFSTAWAVRAVHANSPDDIWVAGLLAIDNFHGVPFLAHFDGQRWDTYEGTIFEVPNPQGSDPLRTAGADAIVYFAADDIWVAGAGESPQGSGSCPVASHFDGSNLEESTPQIQPFFGRQNNIHAADGVATDDVWIVGDGRNTSGTFRTLMYHWNGSTWTSYTSWSPLPGPASLQDELNDVAAVGPDDVWGAGVKLITENGVTRSVSLYLHWDGSGWNEVAGPDIGPLTSIAAISADEIWVSCGFGEYGGRLAHWDGAAWSEAPSAPIPDATHIALSGLTAEPGGSVWGIGYWGIYDGAGGWSTFENIIEHMAPGCDAGDVDGDGDVDLADLALLLSAFGSCSGDPSYNPDADFNTDGCIRLDDLAILLGNFGV